MREVGREAKRLPKATATFINLLKVARRASLREVGREAKRLSATLLSLFKGSFALREVGEVVKAR